MNDDLIAHLRATAQRLLEAADVLERMVEEDEYTEDDAPKRRVTPTPLSVIIGGKK